MDITKQINAVTYINTFKHAINDVWDKYAVDLSLDSLVYSKGVYGAMQHEELKEILVLLDKVNENINYLCLDCQSIPEEAEAGD